MDDKELYRQILGVVQPWKIIKIDPDMSRQEVNIYLEYPLPTEGICPKCGKTCPVYDKREERIWRHLDTWQLRTFIHCKTPRVTCSEHKTITMDVPWSSNMSRFTNQFERFAIDRFMSRKMTPIVYFISSLSHRHPAACSDKQLRDSSAE
jgi:transposase